MSEHIPAPETAAPNPQFDAFVAALKALCITHGVMLTTSGYDLFQAHRLKPGEDPLYSIAVEDLLNP